jgi:hypothetical protein
LAQIPDKFKNLKVYQEGISKEQLVEEMKGITSDLGTRCWFCHDGEGDDLSTYDFASDKKPQKNIARGHMKMTMKINQEFFVGRGAVRCMTCHRGKTQPATQ